MIFNNILQLNYSGTLYGCLTSKQMRSHTLPTPLNCGVPLRVGNHCPTLQIHLNKKMYVYKALLLHSERVVRLKSNCRCTSTHRTNSSLSMLWLLVVFNILPHSTHPLFICVCMVPCNVYSPYIKDVFLPHTQYSWDRLQIHCIPDHNKQVTGSE